MNGIIATIGGRKFASFAAAAIGLVVLHVAGIELTPETLEAITGMFMALCAGNGVEHIARQFGGKGNDDWDDQ